MKAVIIMVLIVWFVSAIVRAKQQQRMERIEAEQRRAKQVQIAQAKEQARQAKELEKHEAMLLKHEEEIRKLKSAKVQAEVDLKLANERMNQLYALLDIAEKQEAACGRGGKEQEKAARKIMAIRSQLAAAKKKQLKAKQVIREANIKLKEVA